MSPNELRARLQGVIGFPVTPFNATCRSTSRACAAICGPCCSTRRRPSSRPAAPASSIRCRRASTSRSCARPSEETQGKVPVIAGVGFNVPIAIGLARQAAEAGASGILAFPPYYPGAEDDGLLEYYQAIGSATGLGLIIYSRDWFHPSAGARRAPQRHIESDRMEGRSGRHPAPADSPRAGRRPAALDWWRRRRPGAGLLRHRHPRVHVERRQRVREDRWQLHDTASRGDHGGAPVAHVDLRRPALRAAREAPRLRSVGDEVADGPARPRRRARSPAARESAPEEVDSLRAALAAWRAVMIGSRLRAQGSGKTIEYRRGCEPRVPNLSPEPEP